MESTRGGKAWAWIRSAMPVVARIGALVLVFVALEWFMRAAGRLPADAYAHPFIALGFLRKLGEVVLDVPVLAGLAATAFGTVLASRSAARRGRPGADPRRLLARWSALEHGVGLRVVIGIVTAITAWAFSTYDYNLYFDQGHYADRLLLVVLAALVWWRPVFVIAFVPFLVAMVGQLDHPMGGFPWTHVNFPIRILTLFAAALLLEAMTGRSWVAPFLVVLVCLVAANYWYSGLGKMRLGWIAHRHLNLLVLGAYANGWLAFLEPATVVRISEWLAWANTPLMVFTLVVEWGAVLILFRRWSLVGLLLCAIGFHLGIFAYTGMLFWMWILVEAALLWFLLAGDRIRRIRIFTPAHFLTSAALIVGCGFWLAPTNLSWYDTPLTYSVRLEGVGASGASHELPTGLLSPYSDTFFLGLFHHLSSNPQMTSVMGAAWLPGVADSLVAATTAEQVFEIENRFPGNVFDEAQNERFDDFVRGFIGTLNRKGRKPITPYPLQAPPHLWPFPRGGAYDGGEPIARVRVWHVLTFYDGATYREIDRRLLREIEVG